METILMLVVFFIAGCALTPLQPVDYQTEAGREAARSAAGENHLSTIVSCFTERLDKNDQFQCRLTYLISVDRMGKPSEVKLDSAEGCQPDDSVVPCLRTAIMKWKLPPAKGDSPAAFTFPIQLRKRGAGTTP